MSRALRRHRERVATVYRHNIYIHAYGWRSWVDGWHRRNRHWAPMAKLLMTESGHKWWRKEFMTRPDRALEHRQLHLIERGVDPDSFARWPTHRDWWVYYW